ncbi:hypothetical protein BS50DRAFT_639332 [Corynespora cassiicola Philippines]|uniref:Rhodopsin domain-containing protein n=1 Tax=Corynespora cassiicola Philippines TaxID=1448308 RepID=A0A2T2N922_CORCC|nr:hypothetical protein BS50DRAFT_639332 [Corynespora cassiicola Philippines]
MGSPGNTITSDHRGPAVNIAVWLCFILCTLCIVAKVWTKLGRRGRELRLSNLQFDDYLLVASLMLMAVYSVIISQQVNAGLGKHVENVEKSALERYEKLDYASHFLYLGAICTANAAGIIFGLMLEPNRPALRLLYGVMGLNILWFIASTLATAFQCAIPATWQSVEGKCFDQATFWTTTDLISVFINMSIFGLLCHIVGILQMSRTKYLLFLLFAMRMLVIVPVTFKIRYIFRTVNAEHVDATSVNVDIAISSILVVTTTIMATSIPFMKPVMQHLQPGWSTGTVRLSVGVDHPTSSDKTNSNPIHILETRSFQVSSSKRSQQSSSRESR